MKTGRHKPARPASFATLRISALLGCAFLLLTLGLPVSSRAADTYGTMLDKHFEPGSKAAASTPSPPNNTTNPDTAALERALKARAQKIAEGPPPPPPPSLNPTVRTLLPWLALAIVTAIVSLVSIRVRAFRIAAAEAREAAKLKKVGEDPTVVALLEELQHGLAAAPVPVVPEVQAVATEAEKEKLRNQAVPADDAAFLFFEIIPAEFKRLRENLSKATAAADDDARLASLAELAENIRPTKTVPQLPALRSYRLLALALEGMFKQLSHKASNLTDWRLRLARESLDLLEDLCAPNLSPDLAIDPPIRMLVVDDCAVSRRSMAMALKKVFHEPDLAAGGEPALELAGKHTYDVIFLDIEMPGMDGFELCSKIRETPLNGKTPIVFVTSHDSFESRAKLVAKGAQDLIGKPYLPTEINLKALQLSLQGRLQNGVRGPAAQTAPQNAPAAATESLLPLPGLSPTPATS